MLNTIFVQVIYNEIINGVPIQRR